MLLYYPNLPTWNPGNLRPLMNGLDDAPLDFDKNIRGSKVASSEATVKLRATVTNPPTNSEMKSFSGLCVMVNCFAQIFCWNETTTGTFLYSGVQRHEESQWEGRDCRRVQSQKLSLLLPLSFSSLTTTNHAWTSTMLSGCDIGHGYMRQMTSSMIRVSPSSRAHSHTTIYHTQSPVNQLSQRVMKSTGGIGRLHSLLSTIVKRISQENERACIL